MSWFLLAPHDVLDPLVMYLLICSGIILETRLMNKFNFGIDPSGHLENLQLAWGFHLRMLLLVINFHVCENIKSDEITFCNVDCFEIWFGIDCPHLIEAQFWATRWLQKPGLQQLEARAGHWESLCYNRSRSLTSCRYSVTSDAACYPCVPSLPLKDPNLLSALLCPCLFLDEVESFSQTHGEFEACLHQPFPNRQVQEIFIFLFFRKILTQKKIFTYNHLAFIANQALFNNTSDLDFYLFIRNHGCRPSWSHRPRCSGNRLQLGWSKQPSVTPSRAAEINANAFAP